MKQIMFMMLSMLIFAPASFGQKPEIRSLPVEGSKPFIAPKGFFETLEMPASVDRFGKIDAEQKKFRLDLYSGLISAENKTVQFVIQIKGKEKKDLSNNIELIYRYLTENKKIKRSRITFAIASESENEVELWLIPNKNITIPRCEDCVMISAEDDEKLKEYFQVKKTKKTKN